MIRNILLVLAIVSGLALIFGFLKLEPFLGTLVVLFGLDRLVPKEVK